MKYVCQDCGSEIPDGEDFCYKCGAMKSKAIVFDDKGGLISSSNKCRFCDADIGPNDLFCQKCGNRITQEQMVAFKPKMVKNGWIGILLALIPGFFNVFGLGHIFFRKWSKGVTYLIMSCFFVYFEYFSGTTGTTLLLFEIVAVIIYLIQAMEVVGLAFMPSRDEKKV